MNPAVTTSPRASTVDAALEQCLRNGSDSTAGNADMPRCVEVGLGDQSRGRQQRRRRKAARASPAAHRREQTEQSVSRGSSLQCVVFRSGSSGQSSHWTLFAPEFVLVMWSRPIEPQYPTTSSLVASPIVLSNKRRPVPAKQLIRANNTPSRPIFQGTRLDACGRLGRRKLQRRGSATKMAGVDQSPRIRTAPANRGDATRGPSNKFILNHRLMSPTWGSWFGHYRDGTGRRNARGAKEQVRRAGFLKAERFTVYSGPDRAL